MKFSNKSSRRDSELDNIIPPEIKNDEFYEAIIKLTSTEKIKTILEIGSSDGSGSTKAFAEGLKRNSNNPILFCLEVSRPRFEKLKLCYLNFDSIKCYNYSSVSKDKFPDKNEIESFYHRVKSNLNNYPFKRVLGWLEQDLEYLENYNIPESGIKKIKEENGIFFFDMVLIDGSEFTGKAELEEIYGAKLILLDGINGYKNHHNFIKLFKDANYELVIDNKELRNGYAIFKRVCYELPIHFFTIVLNGNPFLQYHIEVLSKLPFKWHWHIVEGVAELKHDTACWAKNGGYIPHEFIRNGLSNDGTTTLIDELKSAFPANITIYRKPNGQFWDGKLEMINAPIPNIKEECLLWQLDVDELWNVNQIIKARNLFLNYPEKESAYYFCTYFVNENLAISTLNTYGNYSNYEWLRTWRYEPGDKWISHEPPRLTCLDNNNEWVDKTTFDKFLHEDTKREGLIFQHYAYVLEKQLLFKEKYYGYKNAPHSWEKLKQCSDFPIRLKDYFNWVTDYALVDKIDELNIKPFFVKTSGGKWKTTEAAFADI